MKALKKTPLLRKASKAFLLNSIAFMLLSGVALYFYTQSLLQNEIEEELLSTKDRVEHLLQSNPNIQDIPPVIAIAKSKIQQKNSLKDTLIYDPLQDEVELFRQLSGTKLINGTNYRITVRAMVIESQQILLAIVFIFLLLIVLAFVFLFYLNRSRNAKLWQPFFNNLARIKSFNVKSDEPIHLEESDILEFDELNQEVAHLTSKIQVDYRNLKQFTEDVSHEIQTPLAMMQAKIETGFNEPDLSEGQYVMLSALQDDIRRLKNLNKRLILLAKIENNQFTQEEEISIKNIVVEITGNFRELTDTVFELKGNTPLQVKMDPHLAQILCTNLISNAVKYTIENQPILIKFTAKSLQICNAGVQELKDATQVFDRFYKEGNQKDSTGLGLSIVKKICEHYGFYPSYSFKNKADSTENIGFHCFEIKFFT
ncbi:MULTISPECIES: HAMP domain-containing sensor histidine kinase [unclassified Leeuwenhoekiella]|uniref:sensor histidine kinase n=1 Tax=unclassified Leeuwenhoekiella TaxID=2615029 RepID=UPI0025BA786B|nr:MULTISPECIES: HAMP domain-containing sensor histidine kinase [unclassified Leeuwenhoekiella]|tara:strand:+ start:11231 stop:12511 length:1281 start_codon:yes stop_codon:yes gene_type:complete